MKLLAKKKAFPKTGSLLFSTHCKNRCYCQEQGMRAFLSAVALCLLASSGAFAGPKEDALAVLEKWAAAFAASDVDGITKLYAPDALFMGTGSKTVVKDTADIKKYFEDALLTRRPRAAPISSSEVMVLSDNAVLITGLNESTGVLDGKPFSNPGRVTFVVAKRGPEWQIVHFHRSAMPR
jgi:uncharacterized protein (TIGR02246 family)